MSQSGGFPIDVDRDFPHLAHAPIVEAVIHWQAVPSKAMEREEIKGELGRRFGGYSLHVQQRVHTALSASAESVEARQQTRWDGFRLTSADGKYVGQMRPNSVVLSRLAPYDNWPTFATEALRFWSCFVELVTPVAVDRLGVRFINQVEMQRDEKASDLVNEMPLPSIGLHADSFFREDSLDVPGHPYRVNLVRAIQAPQPTMASQKSLIIDIDAFTIGPTDTEQAAIEQRLKELRYLKDFVFFNYMKEAEKRFGRVL